MTLPTVAKLRIPITLAIAIGEVVGILYFYRQPKFFQFVVLSLLGIMLATPLLWLDFMQRIKVKYFEFFWIPLCFTWTANTWKDGNRGFAIAWAILLLVGVTIVLIRIYVTFRPTKQFQGGRA